MKKQPSCLTAITVTLLLVLAAFYIAAKISRLL